jgi:phage-related protein
MAEDDVDYGRATITIDIDDSRADGESRTAGIRIQRALLRATRRIGEQIRRQIQRGLTATAVTVRVEPDLSRFESALVTGLRSLAAVDIPVAPDVTDFETRLRALLAGIVIPVRVVPDLSGFESALLTDLGSLSAVEVPVVPDVSDFEERLRTLLAGIEVPIPVVPNLRRFSRRIRAYRPPAVVVQVRWDISRMQRALLRATRRIGEQIRRQIQRGLSARTLTVRVKPDLSGFDSALLTGLRSLTSIDIPVAPDVSGFERRLRTLLAGIELSIPVKPDLSGFDSALLTGLRSLTSIDIPVAPDVTDFERRLRALLAGIEIPVRVVPDLDDFDRRIRTHRPPDVNVNVDGDTSRLQRALSGLSRIAGTVGRGLAGLLQFGAIGIAAAGIAQAVGALAPAAGIIAALPAAIAGAQVALGTLRLALIGVEDAFTAAVSGSAKEFEKALEKLSPSAQKAARAVRALKPELTELQKGVQESFFKRFAGEITDAAKNLAPLRKGLEGVAAGFGRAVRAGLKWLQTDFAQTNLKAVIQGTSDAVAGLEKGVQPLLQGFTDIAAAVALAFGERTGSFITKTSTRLGEYLTRQAETGRAVRAVERAVATFRQLWAIVKNVGGALRNMNAIASQSGGGALNALQRITGAFKEFTGSDAGESAIGNMFATVSEAASQLGPILEEVALQVGRIAPALQPVFRELGPALEELVSGVGDAAAKVAPALTPIANGLREAFERIGPVLGPLGESLGRLFEKLAPALPLLGTFAAEVGGVLSELLDLLGEALGPVVEELAETLIPILPELGDAAKSALRELKPFAREFGEGLAKAIEKAGPKLLDLARWAKDIAPLIKKILEKGRDFIVWLDELPDKVERMVDDVLGFFRNLYDELVGNSIIPDLINGITQWFERLPGRVAQVVKDFVSGLISDFLSLPLRIYEGLTGFGESLWQTLTGGFNRGRQAAGQFLTGLMADLAALPSRAFGALASFGGFLWTALTGAFNQGRLAVTTWITGLMADLASLPSRAIGALASFGSSLWTQLTSNFAQARQAVTTWLSGVANDLRSLPSRAGSALSGLGPRVSGAVRSAGASALNAMRTAGAQLVSQVRTLPSRARTALDPLISSLPAPIRRAGSAALSAIRSAGSQIVSFVRTLPSRAANALSGARNALVSAGRDLIRGMISGIRSMAGSIASEARRVVGSAVSSAKRALGISSPSKVFAEIGRDTGRGFVEGLTGTEAKIKATGEKAADAIIRAFQKLKPSRMDEFLLNLIDRSNKKLRGLAAERDKLAKRIAEATKFAADTTKAALDAFSLNDLVQGQDTFTAATITAGLEDAVSRVNKFSNDLDKLARRGLRKDLLEQIVGLGPKQGAQLADVLASATGGSLKRINDLQAQLAKASTALGRTSADVLFDAGKQASKGFLAGLEAERKSIERLMLQIARALQKSIRNALGIRSPSVVMRRIGEMTMAGLQAGLVRRVGALEKAASSAARAMVHAVSSQMSDVPDFGAGGGGVAPLTTSQRLRLADGGGTALASRRARTGGDVIHNHTWNIREVGNARVTAQRVLNQFVLAAGVAG